MELKGVSDPLELESEVFVRHLIRVLRAELPPDIWKSRKNSQVVSHLSRPLFIIPLRLESQHLIDMLILKCI